MISVSPITCSRSLPITGALGSKTSNNSFISGEHQKFSNRQNVMIDNVYEEVSATYDADGKEIFQYKGTSYELCELKELIKSFGLNSINKSNNFEKDLIGKVSSELNLWYIEYFSNKNKPECIDGIINGFRKELVDKYNNQLQQKIPDFYVQAASSKFGLLSEHDFFIEECVAGVKREYWGKFILVENYIDLLRNEERKRSAAYEEKLIGLVQNNPFFLRVNHETISKVELSTRKALFDAKVNKFRAAKAEALVEVRDPAIDKEVCEILSRQSESQEFDMEQLRYIDDCCKHCLKKLNLQNLDVFFNKVFNEFERKPISDLIFVIQNHARPFKTKSIRDFQSALTKKLVSSLFS